MALALINAAAILYHTLASTPSETHTPTQNHALNLSASPLRIPEILDRILDFLHNHPVTLQATSLVCKTWAYTSLYHLRKKLRVQGNLRALKLPELLPARPALKERLTSLIMSCLDIHGWSFVKSILAPIAHLPVLQQLVFRYCTWMPASGTTVLGSHAVMNRKLDEFLLDRCTIQGMALLAPFISYFKHVGDFQISSLEVSPSWRSDQAYTRYWNNEPVVDCLKWNLIKPEMVDVLTEAWKSRSPAVLQTQLNRTNKRDLVELCDKLGSSLEALEMDVQNFSPGELGMPYMFFCLTEIIEKCSPFLGKLNLPKVTRIHISMSCQHEFLDAEDSQPLWLLRLPKYVPSLPSLKSVHYVVACHAEARCPFFPTQPVKVVRIEPSVSPYSGR